MHMAGPEPELGSRFNAIDEPGPEVRTRTLCPRSRLRNKVATEPGFVIRCGRHEGRGPSYLFDGEVCFDPGTCDDGEHEGEYWHPWPALRSVSAQSHGEW